MKVVLISADPDIWAVGTRILSSVLKKQGHKVQMVLLMVKSSSDKYNDNELDELAYLVKDADLIGITMWQEPHVRILAEQLKACLEEAQTNSEGFIDTKN